MAQNATQLTAANNGSYLKGESLAEAQVVCYAPELITTTGIWQGDDPLDFSLPLFLVQLILVVITTRALYFMLKPLRQPPVVSEIIGGIILGPSCLGKLGNYEALLFPLRSMIVLETMANLGLIFFLFLVGLEMDIGVIRRTGRKSLVLAVSGMIIPFGIGTVTSFFLRYHISEGINQGTFLLFLGVALSITAFPVLARILAELKLLNTEIGRLALSASLAEDIFGWVMLALAIALAENHSSPLAALWVVLSGVVYVLLCLFVLRRGILWVIRRTPEGEAYNEVYICFILAGVLVCAFITDAIGIHAIFGSFVFGLVIPSGQLGNVLADKLENFITGLLLPLYFAISGLRTDMGSIHDPKAVILVVILLVAAASKVGSTTFVAFSYGMPLREGFSLGILMNTKGLIEMVALNIGRDHKVLDEEAFAIMVIMAVILTGMVSPLFMMAYKPTRRFIPYKRRTIQGTKPDMEVRILACIHTPRNVPTIINLLEASHPTRKSPIFVYALHLVELTSRSSAMVIVHDSRKESSSVPTDLNKATSAQIISAFQNYEKLAEGITVQPLTAISPYSSMHDDICNLAEDQRVTMIILPFHKQQTVDGGMEASNPALRTVNQNVLANAPCSVGILIDRGLGGTNRVAVSQVSHNIAVLFFGGPDDREALAYAMRMAEQPGINLTVIRFLEGDNVAEQTDILGDDEKILSVITENEKERQMDDEYLNEFRIKKVRDEAVVYTERVVNNGEETVSVISGMDSTIDLYIVGRGQGMISPLTAGLTDWSECPELGAIGDVLASSDFAATVSVMVIQQYMGAMLMEGVGTPDSPTLQREQLLYQYQRQPMPSGMGAYDSHRAWNSSPVAP